MSKLKSIEELFEGRHFDREVIIVCVRWYPRFKLSLRDLVEMMAERGLWLAHTTIMRWVQRYTLEFAKRWSRFGRPVGRSWRVDETTSTQTSPTADSATPHRASPPRKTQITHDGWVRLR